MAGNMHQSRSCILPCISRQETCYCRCNGSYRDRAGNIHDFRLQCTRSNFSICVKLEKFGGKSSFCNQTALSFLYFTHWNKKWFSFSTRFSGFSHTWHVLDSSISLSRAHLPVSNLNFRQPSLIFAKNLRWIYDKGFNKYEGVVVKLLNWTNALSLGFLLQSA